MTNRDNTSGSYYGSPDGRVMQARFMTTDTESIDELVLAFQNLRSKFLGRKRTASKAARAARAAVGFAATR